MGIDIDAEVSAGRLSADGLRQLFLAEVNGNATPMFWLEKRLRHMKATIEDGRPVEVAMQNGSERLVTAADFEAWCARVLPAAFAAFFGPDT